MFSNYRLPTTRHRVLKFVFVPLPSSTTTNTAPPSFILSRSHQRSKIVNKKIEDVRIVVRHQCRQSNAIIHPCSPRARATSSAAAATARCPATPPKHAPPHQGPGRGNQPRRPRLPQGGPQEVLTCFIGSHGSILEPSDIETMADECHRLRAGQPRPSRPHRCRQVRRCVVATGRGDCRPRSTTSRFPRHSSAGSTPRSRRDHRRGPNAWPQTPLRPVISEDRLNPSTSSPVPSISASPHVSKAIRA